jgi:hypothetical protein
MAGKLNWLNAAIGLVAIGLLSVIVWFLYDARQVRLKAEFDAKVKAAYDSRLREIESDMKDRQRKLDFDRMVDGLGKPE